MYTTVREAITETARAVGLTNAQNMTPYSDELVLSYLAGIHTIIRDEIEWAEMTQTFIRTLDGTTGRISQTITGVTDWKRIRRVYQEGFQTPLSLLSSYINPLESPLLLGYSAMPTQDDLQPPATGRYLLQFWPLNSTARVLLQVDREVDWSDDEQVLPIDFWLHVWGAAMMWGAADAANATQLAQNTKMFSTRLNQCKARENSRPLFSQPNQLQPNDWWEADAPYA